ncbi:homeobox-leucine zipper protein ATHB-40-like [Andrographis paniculata]|uniref:homeobox-leucine zipper protein ATHB-40-like n=1 Tax=Andrographis paniculata TaxID=175694 RepID=UPI0021E75460|nr:homeobox-leucine zipper protein ATHB-40-like [Andrographis paniculata]
MNPEVDDPTVLISGCVGGASSKRRRRVRRKGKSGETGERNRKRKLSWQQISMLEESFRSDQKLETRRKDLLAAELGLDPRQVAVWFQNRRARWRTSKMAQDYSHLRSEHHHLLLHNRILDAQVTELKEQVQKGEKEIKRLSDHGLTSNSQISSSSILMEASCWILKFGGSKNVRRFVGVGSGSTPKSLSVVGLEAAPTMEPAQLRSSTRLRA